MQSKVRLYPVVFCKHFVFSLNLTGTLIEADQNCTLPLVKNGKIGNTSCLISCDLDLWGMDPGQYHCTSSQWGQHLYQVRW